MSDRDRAMARLVAHFLRHSWNPIGLGAEGPADEYDGYVPSVVALMKDRSLDHQKALVDHLARIAIEQMKLSPAVEVAERAARSLHALSHASWQSDDRPVRQMISDDGQHSLHVFGRADGLFFYQHSSFYQIEDVNGIWSSWRESGVGRSGLFETAEDAERDARAAIAWLR